MPGMEKFVDEKPTQLRLSVTVDAKRRICRWLDALGADRGAALAAVAEAMNFEGDADDWAARFDFPEDVKAVAKLAFMAGRANKETP